MSLRPAFSTTFCIAALAIGLIGCTSRHSAGSPVPASRPERGRFELEITANDAEQDVLVEARGAFDVERGRYSISLHAAATWPGPLGDTDVVQLPDATYVRSIPLARAFGVTTPWMRIEGAPGRGLSELPSLLAGLVRSGTMRFDAPGETGRVSVRFVDAGAPVEIEPPPPAEVTDVTAAVSARGGLDTGG